MTLRRTGSDAIYASCLRVFALVTFALAASTLTAIAGVPSRSDVCAAMARATSFMFDHAANQGGFVWLYTQDLEPYGELKARDSMIWVEPPGTPSVGLVLLEAHKATEDDRYLRYAEQVAGALIRGQHPSGGWNYLIDFDPDGLPAYWDSFFTRCWGWQEYVKQRDNCTFDDYVTTEATRFFLRLGEVSPKPSITQARDQALGHILSAQYPNGAWPQRYPPEPKHKDYTECYTFNDGVMTDCIAVLLEAHEALGDARYYDAARKGMDFYLLSQLPEPQPGWAQQYDHDLQPAWGRPFEVGTICSGQTLTNIQDLMRFFQVTGERKYLGPIPRALDWLERVRFRDARGYSHTNFYEMGTDRPVYIKQTGSTTDDVRFTLAHEEEGCYPYGVRVTIPVDEFRREYEQLAQLPPSEARAAYRKALANQPLVRQVRGGYAARALADTRDTAEGVADMLASMDPRGGWLEPIALLDPFSPFTAPKQEFAGYTTGGYIARMYRMITYLNRLAPEQ